MCPSFDVLGVPKLVTFGRDSKKGPLQVAVGDLQLKGDKMVASLW